MKVMDKQLQASTDASGVLVSAQNVNDPFTDLNKIRIPQIGAIPK